MNRRLYIALVSFLVIVLAVVSFYVLWVHVPYYNYHNGLAQIRNQICETNNYEYLDYFNEHRGKEKYYILKVNINSVESYVAYNEALELVRVYQGSVASEESVKADILNRYKDDVSESDLNTLDIGYENNKFVYYVLIQKEESLLYLYYDLDDGEFLKAYRIASDG